jgi:hypothetical protein
LDSNEQTATIKTEDDKEPAKQQLDQISEKSKYADILSIYQIYIEYMRHENTLIKDRSVLLLATQFGLFAAMGFCVQNVFKNFPPDAAVRLDSSTMFNVMNMVFSHPFSVPYTMMIVVISFFGALSASFGARGILAAKEAQLETYRAWRTYFGRASSQNHCETAIAYNLPALMGGGVEVMEEGALKKSRVYGGSLLARGTPVVLTMAWLLASGLLLYFLIQPAEVPHG